MAKTQPLNSDQRERFLIQVGHSLNMITELPLVAAEGSSDIVQIAAIDAFYVHARGLIEFFLCPTSHSVSVTEYLSDWQWTSGSNSRLARLYGEVNEQTAHLSPDRVAKGHDVVNEAPQRLVIHADEIVELADEWAARLNAAGSPHAKECSRVVSPQRQRLGDVRQRLSRLPTDRSLTDARTHDD